MAKIRVVNTRFWIDDYISNLDPIEKLLFLYFLTNPMTDICGVYEIPLKIIAVETGIDKEMVIKILSRFERDNKIFYLNGWIGIKNFRKHQSLNPKVSIGIENGLKQAPKELLDRLCIGYDSLSHSNLNSNLNSNTNSNVVSNLGMTTPEDLRDFDRFWSIYPKQERKNLALQEWVNLKPSKELIEKIVEAVGRQKNSEQWQEVRYIPHPYNWLAEKRWEEEVKITRTETIIIK